YDKSIEIIDDNTYVVDGLIQIQDLNRYFKININEEAETLSGVIIERLGYIPQNKVDKEFSIEGLIIKVQSIKNNHIDKVIIKKETS
ncbi:MAG: transporter associated domain-containing protein, partial [Candidatus Izemoplasmatales bacterium]